MLAYAEGFHTGHLAHKSEPGTSNPDFAHRRLGNGDLLDAATLGANEVLGAVLPGVSPGTGEVAVDTANPVRQPSLDQRGEDPINADDVDLPARKFHLLPDLVCPLRPSSLS